MKKSLLALFGFLLLAIALPASAQVTYGIPWDGPSAGKSLPAGSIMTLGSTNAHVDSSGNLFVNACTGCGGSGGFTPGGDLGGSSSVQEVTGILSNALPSLTIGYLNWTGTAWNFATVPNVPYPAGSGIPIVSTGTSWGTTITATNGDVLFGSGGVWDKSAAPAISAANMTSFPTFNQNTTGNAATATALASAPTLCITGQAPTGILASGNATGCAPTSTYPTGTGIPQVSSSTSWGTTLATSGSGNVALTTSAVFTTPSLGTPSAVNLTNGTALPLTTGVSGVLSAANGGEGVTNTATLKLGTSNINLATLGTGIMKNTLTTGAVTDAASSDVITLFTGTCNSGTFLNGAGACSTPSGSAFTPQTNGTNNTTLTGVNFITSTTNVDGLTVTPSNPATVNEIFEVSGTTNAAGGGTGISSPAAHSLLVAEGSGNFNLVTSGSTNGYYACGFNIIAGAAVDPSCALSGVPVVLETGASDTLAYSYRANFLAISGGSTFGFTLPTASGNLASNLPISLYNGNSGNATFTPTTPNNINAGTSQAVLTVLPKFADFIYQDAASPINWHDLGGGVPTYAAFGSTCTNGLTWSTSTGIGCASAAPLTTYPGAGIADSTGSAWGTSYTTSGTGTVLALTTSPTFTTPSLGVPTALTLTNATGLPLSTGVTGTLAAAQFPALIGDLTGTATSLSVEVTGLLSHALPSLTTGYLNWTGSAWALNSVSGGGVTSVNTLTGPAVVIEAATAGQMAVSGGNAAALTGAADMTYATHTFATTASGIFDWSAATGTAALKVPSNAGNTATAAAVIDFDTTANLYHGFFNGADHTFLYTSGPLGTPSSGTLTNATGLPINGVVSATGAITPIALGNNPLVITSALTSGTTNLTNSEATASTTAGAVLHQITALTTSTAIPLQITQGAAGPASANAPAIINISAAAAGGAASGTHAGYIGAPITLLTGAGSNASTTGAGGAGGAFSLTTGAGGNGTGTSQNGGAGGAFNVTTGVGGTATTTAGVGGAGGAINLTAGAGTTSPGASGTGGAGGSIVVTPGAGGAANGGTAGVAGVLSVAGTTAGFFGLTQGSANTTANTNIPANTIIDQAPTAVTAYTVTRPGTAAQGIMNGTLSGSVITQGFSGDANHSATVSWSTATSVGSTSLCSTTFCPAGTYRVSAYIDVTTACTTTGSYLVNVIYTDDTTVSKTAFIPLEGTGTTFATGVIVPTATTDFGTGSFILRSTGAASINYSTTAAACGTGGPGVGKLYLTVEPVM